MSNASRYETFLADKMKEGERLHLQHKHVKRYMGDRLLYAPMTTAQQGLRVLDVATSDGLWLRDLRSIVAHPESAQLIGTDITNTRFPADTVGIQLEQRDSTEPWPEEWKSSFDLVHQRYGVQTGKDHPQRLVSSLSELVKPGGWIQLVELDDTSTEPCGPFVHQWNEQIRKIARTMDITMAWYNGGLERMVREAGLTRVGTAVVPQLHGAADPDPDLSTETTDWFCSNAAQFTYLTGDDKDRFLAALREEVKTRGAYTASRVVWGQRPLITM